MNKQLGIEVGELDINFGNFPKSLYEGCKKKWSNRALYIPRELIEELEKIVEQYMRVMGLDTARYPVRVDLGFSETGEPVIYEITTGFVDQVGSCLLLQQELGDTSGLETLCETPFDSSLLTSEPYRPEYEIMRNMFSESGKPLLDNIGKSCFVYGYPSSDMKGKDNFIPGFPGIAAENKKTQGKVSSRLLQGTNFIMPRSFSPESTLYEDLPDERYTKLIFKQDLPKQKGDRNTIMFGKGKQVQERYRDADMVAQEYIPAYRDSEGRRYEAKAIFMPSQSGINFSGLYNLVDEYSQNKSFANTRIPNDGYPQGPGIIT